MRGRIYKPQTIESFDIRWYGGDRWSGRTKTDIILSENGFEYGKNYPINELTDMIIRLACLGNLSIEIGQNSDQVLTLYVGYI